jgi:hypothetical protein
MNDYFLTNFANDDAKGSELHYLVDSCLHICYYSEFYLLGWVTAYVTVYCNTLSCDYLQFSGYESI